jgi:hypothetical protein
VGYQSGMSNTTGNENYFSGYRAGSTNTTGSYNTFTGIRSGASNTVGGNNVFTGFQSGLKNTSGANNLFGGYNSGLNNTVGSNNVFAGNSSGLSNTSGVSNTFAGANSGLNNTRGNNNVFIGTESGAGNVSSDNNVGIGYQAGPSVDGLTNAGAIGYRAKVSQSNSLVLGGTGAEAVKVGIGTTAPAQRLEVAGNVLISGSGNGLIFADGTVQTTAGAGTGAYTEASAPLTLTTEHQTVRRVGACNALTLPNPGSCKGKLYTIINSSQGSTQTLALLASSGGSPVVQDDVLNTTVTSLPANQRLTIQSDGTKWIVLSRN